MLIKTKTFRIISQNLNWVILALLFFLFGVITAVFVFGNEGFFLAELTEVQKSILHEMAELIFQGFFLRGILLLFLNNLFASLQMMLLGIVLGIPSLLGLFTNGALLGSMITILSREGQPVLPFVVLGILPHGIFELPAFFISAAFGLKLGFHLIFPLPQKKRRESLAFIWKEYWSLFPLILNLLILAAIVEVVITPLLLGLVLK
jgi:stage II sporulation protein M